MCCDGLCCDFGCRAPVIGASDGLEVNSNLPRRNGFVNRFNLLPYIIDCKGYSGIYLNRVRSWEERWNQSLTRWLHHFCRM